MHIQVTHRRTAIYPDTYFTYVDTTTSFSLRTSLRPCRPCRHTHGPQGPLLSKAHASCHVAPSVSSQTPLGSCLGNSVLAARALKGTEAMFNAFACPVYLILSLFFKLCLCLSRSRLCVCLLLVSFFYVCLFFSSSSSPFLSPLLTHTGTHAQAAPHLLAHTRPH